MAYQSDRTGADIDRVLDNADGAISDAGVVSGTSVNVTGAVTAGSTITIGGDQVWFDATTSRTAASAVTVVDNADLANLGTALDALSNAGDWNAASTVSSAQFFKGNVNAPNGQTWWGLSAMLTAGTNGLQIASRDELIQYRSNTGQAWKSLTPAAVMVTALEAMVDEISDQLEAQLTVTIDRSAVNTIITNNIPT